MISKIQTWIDSVKEWFNPTPQAKSALYYRRVALAMKLDGLEGSDRWETLEEYQRTDPELYQSWLQHPFSWEE